MLHHATLADLTQYIKKGATVRQCEMVHEKSDSDVILWNQVMRLTQWFVSSDYRNPFLSTLSFTTNLGLAWFEINTETSGEHALLPRISTIQSFNRKHSLRVHNLIWSDLLFSITFITMKWMNTVYNILLTHFLWLKWANSKLNRVNWVAC